MVFSGFVMLCRFAGCPTMTSPLSKNATTDGVVRAPSAFSITFEVLPSITATQELVVPRSMPIAFAMGCLHWGYIIPWVFEQVRRCRQDAPPWEDRNNVLAALTDHAASLTSLFFASLCAGFGIFILRTPFAMVASTLAGSIPTGNWNAR